MKKKFVALLLTAAMTFGIAGCGDSTAASGSENESAGGNGTVSEETGGTADGEISHLIVAFPTWTGAPADVAVVQDAVNKITVEKLGIEVEFQISDVGSFKQNMTLAISGGEQIDIMNSLFASYDSLVTQGYLMDLEENDLLANYGQGIIDAVGQEYIDACRVSGILYGVPNNREYAQGRGCIAVGTEYLDAVGYTAPADAGEIIRISEDEINDLFAKMHEAFPDMEVFRPLTSGYMQYSSTDQLGGNAFGVLLDYGKELKVENQFMSDEYLKYCQMIYDWNQKGYVSKDASTDTTAVSSLVSAGTLISHGTGGKPGSKAQESLADGRDMTIFQTKEDIISSGSIAAYPWTIPVTCSDPAAAMRLLNEFYTNAELADLIVFGIEGVHYEINEDGLLDASKGSNAGAYGTLGWIYPNQFLNTVTVGNSPDLWDEIRSFNQEARKSAAVGFSFDTTAVSTELTALQNIMDEYQKSLELGLVAPETLIPEMNQKLMDAGLQKVIDEKQRQLDEWAANK